PDISILLTVSSLLYLLNVAESIFSLILEAGLLGSLIVGIIYGPEGANLLPEYLLQTLLVFGYIGLILLIFEAGINTNISLLYKNMALSVLVAGTGVILPIAFSIFLLHFGFGYGVLQGFAAGASLSSTSLGTTLALLKPEFRQTRTGVVLLSAALFDDVVGLIIAAIIQGFSNSSNADISWPVILRPILVSVAFALVAGLLVWVIRPLTRRMSYRWKLIVYQGRTQLCILTIVVSGFVAGASYAGTSELYGAYLAGVIVAQIFLEPPRADQPDLAQLPHGAESPTLVSSGVIIYTPHLAFTYVLSPIFFASIGAALPIRSLGSVDGSSRVVWRGLVYALLMAIAKALTGIWLLIPPSFLHVPTILHHLEKEEAVYYNRQQTVHNPNADSSDSTMSRMNSAVLLGLAMIARGEVALIVSQLARPILTEMSQELYAMVIWAILLDTVGGALGVGLLLRRK
ncbi:Sodium/hydrogen exchanger, partial [Gymnopus androsaceus JB14]